MYNKVRDSQIDKQLDRQLDINIETSVKKILCTKRLEIDRQIDNYIFKISTVQDPDKKGTARRYLADISESQDI